MKKEPKKKHTPATRPLPDNAQKKPEKYKVGQSESTRVVYSEEHNLADGD